MDPLLPVPFQPTPEEDHLAKAAEKIFTLPGAGTDRAQPTPTLDPATAKRAAEAERKRLQLDAKAAQRNALVAGVKAREALARWKSQLDRWDATSARLLDGDDGRPVAGGVEFVRQFRAVLHSARPSQAEYDEAHEAVEQILAPIERASQDPDDLVRPGSEVQRSLEARARLAAEAADRWKEAVQEMRALATLARHRGLNGKSTLRQAIDDLENDLAVERLKEKNAKLDSAEKQAADTDAAIAAAKVADAANTRRLEAEAARKKQTDEAERAKKRQYARGDEVRRHLGSLMEKGFTQPEGAPGYAYPKKVGEERPVSLAALRTSGCLERGLAGQKRLAGFMANPNMDRTRWSIFPEPELWQPDQQRFIIKAQQLLIEYGEAMVDERLLAP